MFQYPAISSIPKICRILTFFRFRFLIVTAVLSPVLLFYPGHEEIHDPLLLTLRKLSSLRDMVPLFQAPSAAAGTGMLRLKDGVAAHLNKTDIDYNMMQGSKAHFAQLAVANVGLGPAKHEQVAT